jgi:hypothetical protein
MPAVVVTPTAEPTSTVTPTPIPPTPTSTPEPSPTPPPATPTPVPEPTATPMPEPTDTPQPEATPTDIPPTTPTPAAVGASPGGRDVDATLNDTDFTGGYRNPDGSVYAGRPATWVYGARTNYSTMTASFALTSAPAGPATLTVRGLDSEGPQRTTILIALNDVEIFRGPSPFADDDENPNDAPWTEHSWRVPPNVMRAGANTLTIRNLEDVDNEGSPPWFMLDWARIQSRP